MNLFFRRKTPLLRRELALLAVTLVGCSGGSEHNLVGTWQYRGGLSPLAGSANPQPPGGEQESQPAGITLRFFRGGKLQTETHQGAINSVKEGTWSWLHYDPASHVGAIQCRLLGQKTDHRIEFLNPDTIRLNPPNLAGTEQQLQFEREP